MDNVFLGEVRLFAGNFPPYQWMFCNGQLLAIRQYSALFSLLGTNYGGDGTVTFALPNFQGNIPVGAGQGNGLTDRVIGEQFGSTGTTLLMPNLPPHTHTFGASSTNGSESVPTGNIPSSKGRGDTGYTDAAPNTVMNPLMITPTGGNLPVSNMQPYLALNFIIALAGVFPSRG